MNVFSIVVPSCSEWAVDISGLNITAHTLSVEIYCGHTESDKSSEETLLHIAVFLECHVFDNGRQLVMISYHNPSLQSVVSILRVLCVNKTIQSKWNRHTFMRIACYDEHKDSISSSSEDLEVFSDSSSIKILARKYFNQCGLLKLWMALLRHVKFGRNPYFILNFESRKFKSKLLITHLSVMTTSRLWQACPRRDHFYLKRQKSYPWYISFSLSVLIQILLLFVRAMFVFVHLEFTHMTIQRDFAVFKF